LRIIDGINGPFVAMPSRRITSRCDYCGYKNHLKAGFCNQCGGELRSCPARDEPRATFFSDIVHPINQSCRDQIQEKILAAFHLEQERAKQPGYVCSYDEFEHDLAPRPRSAHRMAK